MTYLIGDKVDIASLHWQSDWDGYEVGYDDILIVGFYSSPDGEVDYYIDVETGKVIDIFLTNEDEEERIII